VNGWRRALKPVVERQDTPAGRVFDYVILALIVLSLITFAAETLPGLEAGTRRLLRWFEIIIVAIFTIEYLLRVLVADRRLGFIFSFYGLVDLAAILPFYLPLGIDLRSIRIVRLLRLFRLAEIARYSKAVRRLTVAFRLAREELILFLCASAIVIYLASVGIYYFENAAQPDAFPSVFHALWWAVVTLTTVGYGDVYPITAAGRTFTGLVLFVGLGVVAVPAGVVASALSQARAREDAAAAEAPDSRVRES
jgi:voltage-gated potassium channel